MTAEHVFRFYRAYKFFYRPGGYNDLNRYAAITCPPLINQRERQFYYRIAQQLNDTTVHALYTYGFFFNPGAHISILATPDAFSSALVFAGRGENGTTLLQHDLYELRKRFVGERVDGVTPILEWVPDWLYADDGNIMPPCVQEIISGELPLDLAALLLLIPQPDLHHQWTANMSKDDMGLGSGPWIDRLKKLDLLLRANRPGWRIQSHQLASEFWHSLNLPTLAPRPVPPSEASLF